MPEALAMVKVGNSACGFLKLTPLSRTSAIAGAVSGVTFNARNPSGTNRIRLWEEEFCPDAMPADISVRPADSSMSERRINISPEMHIYFTAYQPLLSLVLLYDRFVTRASGRLHDNYTPSETLRPGHLPPNKTSDRASSGQGNC